MVMMLYWFKKSILWWRRKNW